MMIWLSLGVILWAYLTTAQMGDAPSSSGVTLLVLPQPGVPILAEEVEERSRKDGTAIEVIKCKIYRDSAGRLRMDSDTRDSSGRLASSYTDLIDPVAGSRTVLIKGLNVAYRMPVPQGGTPRFARFIASEKPTSGNWIVKTEDVGERTIEGFVYKGSRIIQTAEGEPGLTFTIEQWYSDQLKLTGLEVTSGPHGTNTARIQGLRREEPGADLFIIPPDYETHDLDLP